MNNGAYLPRAWSQVFNQALGVWTPSESRGVTLLPANCRCRLSTATTSCRTSFTSTEALRVLTAELGREVVGSEAAGLGTPAGWAFLLGLQLRAFCVGGMAEAPLLLASSAMCPARGVRGLGPTKGVPGVCMDAGCVCGDSRPSALHAAGLRCGSGLPGWWEVLALATLAS